MTMGNSASDDNNHLQRGGIWKQFCKKISMAAMADLIVAAALGFIGSDDRPALGQWLASSIVWLS